MYGLMNISLWREGALKDLMTHLMYPLPLSDAPKEKHRLSERRAGRQPCGQVGISLGQVLQKSRQREKRIGKTFYLFCFFLGPRLWHMEAPWLGTELELQLPLTYATATATWDPSRICDLHQSQILNSASKARDINLHPHGCHQAHYH